MTQHFSSDQEFINRLKLRDRVAFERAYDQYSGALYNIVLKITGTEALAEDVLQSAFLKIWKALPDYDPGKGTVFTWMLNVARNTAIDVVRRKNNQPDIQDLENNVSIINLASPEALNEDTLDLKEQVNKLKPEYRMVIDAVYFYGLTHEEAAKKLDLPLGTLKTRVRQAMSALKKYFDH